MPYVLKNNNGSRNFGYVLACRTEKREVALKNALAEFGKHMCTTCHFLTPQGVGMPLLGCEEKALISVCLSVDLLNCLYYRALFSVACYLEKRHPKLLKM